MSPISTHVLDISLGKPAAGIPVLLEVREQDASWMSIGKGATDKDGRIADLLLGRRLNPGTHRLTFDTASYLGKGQNAFFPQVSVVFNVEDVRRNYHIPLLLSLYGYSIYRGS